MLNKKPVYDIGLVVGKFCPLHLGHELVINTAHAQSKQVVILSYTSKSYYPASHRRLWLSTLYPDAIVIVPESGFPDDDDEAIVHREYCRSLLAKLGLMPDAVFGSDEYIPGFARYLSAFPVVVDQMRKQFPVSGTSLRNGEKDFENWTSSIVKQPLAKTVLFIGSESSGKTTLSEACANHDSLNSSWVPEYGREMWHRRQGKLQFDDMLEIARKQVALEETAMKLQANGFVFCDTSPLVTKFYSEQLFQKVDPELDVLATRTYDYVFLCARDFPYVDDGTRAGIEFGVKQEQYYRDNLTNYHVVGGSVSNRVRTVFDVLSGVKL